MNNAYLLNPDGSSNPMQRIRCSDETRELQDILEKNLDLIPGDQINPEDPRRWICVKRELPIEDPTTGDNRWSCDFLLLDQSGIPTFVECKRFLDSRSRREVIGQMFDYAANGSGYFSRDLVADYLTSEALRRGTTLDGLLQTLGPDSGESLDDYLDLVENNIKQGQVRLVFFMEEARPELRSIVEFLNSQLERTEMLIVEAKQFQSANQRFVIPSLWGYTEEARTIKKKVTVTSRAGPRRRWTEEEFFEALNGNCAPQQVDWLRGFSDRLKASERLTLRMGNGRKTGSLIVTFPELSSRSFLFFDSNGGIVFSLHLVSNDEGGSRLKDLVLEHFSRVPRLAIPEEKRSGYHGVEDWFGDRSEIEAFFDKLEALS
ncbi:hypothetical protein [Pelagicoccus albus]|uniref:Uncharacterized protein n=1 Tax=Pelagicoccus albus TaxID=415222 RepID=A0A7X1B4Z5_9BACT|nr:hypothetical protein [Pelagicoccus albus]MBC2605627.1 hypothetical protein [Pelagicoccus albus]